MGDELRLEPDRHRGGALTEEFQVIQAELWGLEVSPKGSHVVAIN